MRPDYGVITVGGGLSGAALAKMLAAAGRRVLVVEREERFSDRVRGEWMAPWGVAEAKECGIYATLHASCAHESPYFCKPTFGTPRDLRTTTPQKLPALTLYHPAMQTAVLDYALAGELLATDEWEHAGHRHAEAHDVCFKALISVGTWLFDLLLARGVNADQQRERALPLLASEPGRIPDHFFSGPDQPCDEQVRRRLFGDG